MRASGLAEFLWLGLYRGSLLRCSDVSAILLPRLLLRVISRRVIDLIDPSPRLFGHNRQERDGKRAREYNRCSLGES